MLNDKRSARGGRPDDGILRYLRFAALPLVVIILIIVIMRADGKPENGGDSQSMAATVVAEQERSDEIAGESEQELSDETAAASEQGQSAYGDVDISQYALKQDEVPELTMLVQSYFQAKKDCDPELLAQVFGKRGLTEAEIAAEREKMELVKASIKRYDNISCYTVQGPEEGSYVMFPYVEIQYREAGTRMPVLTWAYGKLDENGQYIMTQEVSDDVAEYIGRIGQKPEVQALIGQVSQAAKEAVASDEKLKSVYGRLGESDVSIGAGN